MTVSEIFKNVAARQGLRVRWAWLPVRVGKQWAWWEWVCYRMEPTYAVKAGGRGLYTVQRPVYIGGSRLSARNGELTAKDAKDG